MRTTLSKYDKSCLLKTLKFLYSSFYPLSGGSVRDRLDFKRVVRILRGIATRHKLGNLGHIIDELKYPGGVNSILHTTNYLWHDFNIGGDPSKKADYESIDNLQNILIGFLRRYKVCTVPRGAELLGELIWHCEEREEIKLSSVLSFKPKT